MPRGLREVVQRQMERLNNPVFTGQAQLSMNGLPVGAVTEINAQIRHSPHSAEGSASEQYAQTTRFMNPTPTRSLKKIISLCRTAIKHLNDPNKHAKYQFRYIEVADRRIFKSIIRRHCGKDKLARCNIVQDSRLRGWISSEPIRNSEEQRTWNDLSPASWAGVEEDDVPPSRRGAQVVREIGRVEPEYVNFMNNRIDELMTASTNASRELYEARMREATIPRHEITVDQNREISRQIAEGIDHFIRNNGRAPDRMIMSYYIFAEWRDQEARAGRVQFMTDTFVGTLGGRGQLQFLGVDMHMQERYQNPYSVVFERDPR